MLGGRSSPPAAGITGWAGGCSLSSALNLMPRSWLRRGALAQRVEWRHAAQAQLRRRLTLEF